MTLNFKNPPVNEVIIGVYFRQPIADFRSEHIGMLWAKLHKEFATITQNPMLGPELIVEPEPYPMPRYWLTSHDETTLIQLQKTAFLLNWRKRQASYPHYDNVKEKFDEYYAIFMQFLKDIGVQQDIKIATCELAYINVIERNKYWSSILESQEAIPSFHPVTTGIEGAEMESFRYNVSYQMPNGVKLKAELKSTTKADETNDPVIVTELRTAGNMEKGSKSEADEWFDRAHETIINSFVGMTDQRMQKEVWQLEEKV